jgi:hypothetical protein
MRHLPMDRGRLFALILGVSLAVTGWTQNTAAVDDEDPESEAQVEESSTVPTEELLSTEALSTEALSTEEIDVDDGSYLDAEEKDFRPSEEVPADESIPFPTDI